LRFGELQIQSLYCGNEGQVCRCNRGHKTFLGRIIHGANRPRCKLILVGANRLWGETYCGRNVLLPCNEHPSCLWCHGRFAPITFCEWRFGTRLADCVAHSNISSSSSSSSGSFKVVRCRHISILLCGHLKDCVCLSVAQWSVVCRAGVVRGLTLTTLSSILHGSSSRLRSSMGFCYTQPECRMIWNSSIDTSPWFSLKCDIKFFHMETISIMYVMYLLIFTFFSGLTKQHVYLLRHWIAPPARE